MFVNLLLDVFKVNLLPSKSQFTKCLFVSFLMALAIPIIFEEIYVPVELRDQRLDREEYSRRTDQGESPDNAFTHSMYKIEGIERITHRFSDWWNFQMYLGSVAKVFVVLLVATLIASEPRESGRGT